MSTSVSFLCFRSNFWQVNWDLTSKVYIRISCPFWDRQLYRKKSKTKKLSQIALYLWYFLGAFKAIWWAFFGGKFQYTAVSYFRPCSLSSSSSISLFSFKKRREQKAERPRKALLDLCCLFGMFFWAFFNQDWQVFYTLGKLDLTISKK